MSTAVEIAADRLAQEVAFDFLLGGINVHATNPIGDFGRRHLHKIWRDVQATTGQPFGHSVPEGMIYNSLLPCKAIHAVRRYLNKPPFGYLHRLQQSLFVDGRDINDIDSLVSLAQEFGCPADVVIDGVASVEIAQILEQEFATARGYGTNALPSLLVECGGQRSLLAGGYADADMLVEMVRTRQQAAP